MYRKLKEVFDNKIIYVFKSKLGKKNSDINLKCIMNDKSIQN